MHNHDRIGPEKRVKLRKIVYKIINIQYQFLNTLQFKNECIVDQIQCAYTLAY